MKEATQSDAADIAHRLDVDRATVWQIIQGMKYSRISDLAMAVHRAFLGSSGSRETNRDRQAGS